MFDFQMSYLSCSITIPFCLEEAKLRSLWDTLLI